MRKTNVWAASAAACWAAAVAGVIWWDRSIDAHRAWVLVTVAASTLAVIAVVVHLGEKRLAAFYLGQRGRACPFEDAAARVRAEGGGVDLPSLRD